MSREYKLAYKRLKRNLIRVRNVYRRGRRLSGQRRQRRAEIRRKCILGGLDADGNTRLNILRESLIECPNVHLMHEADLSTIAQRFADERPELLFFNIELAAHLLGQWIQVLVAPPAHSFDLTGRFFGFPKWGEATFAIGHWLGLSRSHLRRRHMRVHSLCGTFGTTPHTQYIPRLNYETLGDDAAVFWIHEPGHVELLMRLLYGPLRDWPHKNIGYST